MSFDPWTLGLQTVNVVVLVWLLGRFFWRPVAKMIDDRRTAIDQALADAESKRQAAETALAEISATRAGLAAERESALAKAQAEGEAARKALLDKARADSTALIATAQDEIKAQGEKAESQWRSAAADLAVDIARRLLAPIATDGVQEAFANRLVKAVATLPDSQRRSLHDACGDVALVVASPIPDVQAKDLRERLAALLESDVKFDIRLDPNLIAGIDLVTPHFTVHNNWRADLDQVREALKHADG